jgi:hypothetical protein
MFEEGVLRTVFGCMDIVAERERKLLRKLYGSPLYSYDEIKEDEKVTTCDTCMRE